jgi:nucleoid DNA-binding protein
MPTNKPKSRISPAAKAHNELIARLSESFGLKTKKQAEDLLGKFVGAVEGTLIANIESDGFYLKLGKFGKFTVKHRPSTIRRIPFTKQLSQISEKRKIKFTVLGELRAAEKKESKEQE